jgi:hypothetical protein
MCELFRLGAVEKKQLSATLKRLQVLRSGEITFLEDFCEKESSWTQSCSLIEAIYIKNLANFPTAMKSRFDLHYALADRFY